MQSTSHYYIYFLRVSSGATYYEKGIDAIACSIYKNFNIYYKDEKVPQKCLKRKENVDCREIN